MMGKRISALKSSVRGEVLTNTHHTILINNLSTYTRLKIMDKLFVLLSSIAVSSTMNAQSFSDNFDSHMDTADLKNSWTGFGHALDGEIYISYAGGTDSSQAAIYVGNWNNGSFFGAQKRQLRADLSGSTSVTIHARATTNTYLNASTTETTEFRLGVAGANGDIWESNINQSIPTSDSFYSYTFTISETAMSKVATGIVTGSLEDALASVTDVRFIFSNTGNGAEDIYLDNFAIIEDEDTYLNNFAIIPEPSTYAILMGLLSLGLIGIKRRIR
jgi:hypothetical protein